AGDTATGSAAGFPWTVVLLAVAAVLLLTAVAAVVLRRRRRTSAAGGGTPPPGTAGPGAGRHGASGPGEGRPAGPSRPATGKRERQEVPSVATGSKSGAVSVIEGGGSGRGGPASSSRVEPAPSGSAPSRSAPGQA